MVFYFVTLDVGVIFVDNDGSMHWEADSRLGNAYWYRRPSAISVEMTAYVLQACLCVGDCKCARSIAKWLNTARNSRGAFVSTQVENTYEWHHFTIDLFVFV